jgi:hypothetical protein
MKITDSKILRFNIKGGYKVKEELWSMGEGDKPTKVLAAYSNNGDFIGPPDFAKHLARRGITQFDKIDPSHSTCSIGFNPKEQKWYGWSHRAIYGFGVGSTVKRGDCVYVPSNRQEYIQSLKDWYFDDELYKNVSIKINRDNIQLSYEIHSVNGTIYPFNITETLDIDYGKGEWTALTLEDAKQMAIDFSKGVS